MSGYKLTKPCPKCPFRSDIPGYLNQARVAEAMRKAQPPRIRRRRR